MIIILEGPDGVGKTTVSKLLAETLKASLVRCPGTTPLGEAVRAVLKDKKPFDLMAMTMAMAGADWDCARRAEELEAVHKNVVMDRCMVSNYVYRAANVAKLIEDGYVPEPRSQLKIGFAARNLALRLLELEDSFPESSEVTWLVWMDASDSVLESRHLKRKDSESDDEFDRLRKHVALEYRRARTNVLKVHDRAHSVAVNTSDLSPEQVVERIRMLLLETE